MISPLLTALLDLLRAATLSLELVLGAVMAYLVLISLSALLAQWGAQGAVADTHSNHSLLPTFAILIPAHDEAAVIDEALRALHRLDYPASHYAAIVVADNCGDNTAALARAAGAEVYERSENTHRAKGYALHWLLATLDAEARRFDAYVVMDADSTLSENFLSCMAAALARGAQVAQGQYRVRNAQASWMSGLRAIAFALFNHLRPLGRSYLGWSAGLKGNGMCFRREVLDRFGWQAYTLAEDAEYHLTLLTAGIHVTYVPAAIVSAEMPTSLRQAQTQQARWEGGRLTLARSHAGGLVRAFLRDGDLARLDAVIEMVVPPLSLVAALTGLACIGAAFAQWGLVAWLALALTLGLGLHILIGAALARLAPQAYLSLCYAPLFIVWKCWVYGVALVRRNTHGWVRTERTTTRTSTIAQDVTLHEL